MTDIFDSYFLWNDALYRKFFEDTSADEVLLYITEDIINEVGSNIDDFRTINEEDGTSYMTLFLYSILLDTNGVVNFLHKGNDNRGPIPRIEPRYLCDSWRERAIDKQKISTAIFEFARTLASIKRRSGFEHKCPCLSYVLFLILMYETDGNYNQIIKTIAEYTEKEDARFVPEQMIELFRSVEDWATDDDGNIRFYSNNVRGKNIFSGMLKYQLVLNNSERNTILDTLYKHGFEWDETNMSYEDFISLYVLPVITDDTIKSALSSSKNKSFFRNLLSNFSLENYSPVEKAEKKTLAKFLLIYDRREKKFVLCTDIFIQENVNFIHPSSDRQYGLYPVFKRTVKDIEEYLKQEVRNEEITIRPINKDCLYFQVSSDNMFYIQVMNPTENTFCFIISKKTLEDVKEETKQTAITDVTNDISIFGEKWNVYYTEKWECDVPDTTKDEDEDIQIYSLFSGIMNPAFKHCYLSAGLPMMKCEKEIAIENISIKKYQNGQYDDSRELIAFYVNPNNHTLLGFYRANLMKEYAEYGIFVGEDFVGSIRIKDCNKYDYDHSIVYDKWGCSFINTEIEGSGSDYYSDNGLYKDEEPEDNNLNAINTSGRHNVLIPLLKSYAYARKETSRKHMTDYDLNKIITYASIIEDWNITTNEMSNVKYTLEKLGYISFAIDKDGLRHIEVNNPVISYCESNKNYILYGSYTLEQYYTLISALKQDRVETQNICSSKKYLPPFICMSGGRIANESHYTGIRVSKEDIHEQLYSYASECNTVQFASKFLDTTTPENKRWEYKREKYGYGYLFDGQSRYSLFRDHNDVNRYIPTGIMKNFACQMNHKPVMMWNKNTSTISFTYSMGIPTLLYKYLCAKTKTVGERTRVFGLNNCLGKEKTMVSFHATDEIKNKIMDILSPNHYEGDLFNYEDYTSDYKLKFARKQEDSNYFDFYYEYVLLFKNEPVMKLQKKAIGKIEVIAKNRKDNSVYSVQCENDNSVISSYILNEGLNWGEKYNKQLKIENLNEYESINIIKLSNHEKSL